MKRFVKEYANFEIAQLCEIPGAIKWDLKRKIDKINKYVDAYEKGLVTEHEAMGKIREVADEKVVKIGVPETFYTGGGIWVTIMFNGIQNHYYAIDSESIRIGQECLTLYNDGLIDEADPTPFVEMVWSQGLDELNDIRKNHYNIMKEDLVRATVERRQIWKRK